MDVEKIKKVNEMSRTLKEHGITDSEESSKMAEEITSVNVPKADRDSAGITREEIERLIESNSRTRT